MSFADSTTQYYHHGRFAMAGGALPDAITAYRTYGNPTHPCIVFPTCYGGRLDSQSYLVGEGKALDTTKYYVVTFALFSNGESSSPSNTSAPYNGPYFPRVTYEDNIRAQYAVLTKVLNVTKIQCVVGFSMGGQQTYYWAVMYPDFVNSFVATCGSARTSPHNICFLEGPKAALKASKDFHDGHYTSTPQFGIRAFGRVYSAWAYGQTWFRNKSYLFDNKFSNLDNFLRENWEGRFLTAWDANDMLTLLQTWQMGDVSNLYAHSTADSGYQLDTTSARGGGGDFAGALKRIKAKGLIMPCKTDLYFPPEDSEIEVQTMGDKAKLVVIPSVWGHAAGGGANPEDVAFISKQITEFLGTV